MTGHDLGTEFAWRVHTAQTAWARNADAKASILLALEGGALYTSAGGKPYPAVSAIGLAALLLAIIAGIIAIFPRLGREDRDRSPQVIYFGDLRRWDTAELTRHITRLSVDDELEMLSRQLTAMARRNWTKHLWVRLSLVLALTGIAMIAISAMGRFP